MVAKHSKELISKLKNNLMLDIRTTTSCDFHRIVLPFSYCMIKPKVPVFVFNRIASGGIEVINQMKAQGVKIVMDIDDHYMIDPSHYLYETFKKYNMTENLVENLKAADIVMTTTPLLASELRHLNRNIVVVPNALPFDQDQFTLSTDKVSKTPVVWAGGASHLHDLDLIRNVRSLQNKTTIVGYNSGEREWLKIKSQNPYMTYQNQIPLSNYMTGFNGHQIVIAPLTESRFNSCKSNLKVLEAGAKGLPIIASKVEPYFNSVDKNVIIYAENKVQWEEEITKLMAYKDYREDKAGKLAEHVRLNYDLNDANEIRRQVLESFS